MSLFRFKQFSVANDKSAMKVNTDGVLLGACACLKETDHTVLDVGTGTGCIAMMIAQRLSAMGLNSFEIDSLDIDPLSVEEAKDNFEHSPWSAHLDVQLISLQSYRPHTSFDLIVSNPPYFSEDLRAPDSRRDMARHSDDSLPVEDLMSFASEYLSREGRLAVIMPVSREIDMMKAAQQYAIYPLRTLRIRSTESRPYSRVIAEFGRYPSEVRQDELTIQTKGRYTDEYISLTKDYYLNF